MAAKKTKTKKEENIPFNEDKEYLEKSTFVNNFLRMLNVGRVIEEQSYKEKYEAEMKKQEEKRIKSTKEAGSALRFLIIFFAGIFTLVSIFGWISVVDAMTEQNNLDMPSTINATYINDSLILDNQGDLVYRLSDTERISHAEDKLIDLGLLSILISTFISIGLWIVIINSFITGKVIELNKREVN